MNNVRFSVLFGCDGDYSQDDKVTALRKYVSTLLHATSMNEDK